MVHILPSDPGDDPYGWSIHDDDSEDEDDYQATQIVENNFDLSEVKSANDVTEIIEGLNYLGLVGRVRARAFNSLANILRLLQDIGTQDKVTTLLWYWYFRTFTNNDTEDEDYVPIRPKKKKSKGRASWQCKYCGVRDKHYAKTCPKYLDELDRNALCRHILHRAGHPAADLC